MKKIKLSTIIYTVLAVIALALSIVILNTPNKAKDNGEVTIEVISISDEVIKSKEIKYKQNDTLKDLIVSNFNEVYFEDSSYGPFLKNIEGYVTPADYSTYISLYINNEYSLVGIGDITLSDGLIVSLVITDANEW